MKQYIHAVPNFSEGRRAEVIEQIVRPFREIPGVKLIGHFPDGDFNRTVVEAIGEPAPLREALLAMTKASMEHIDMNYQTGNHPRIGAQDTIPLFPLKDITLEECTEYAEALGQAIYETLGLPVYFSGENARTEERKSLNFIRKGHYEALKDVAHTEERRPDLGEGKLHPTAGAVILSAATTPLLAFNVILDSDNLDIAKTIAKALRGPSGGFSTVRSVGLMFTERNQVCVSMNMLDFRATPLFRTFEFVKGEAARYGVNVVASQIVGAVRQEALVAAAEHYLRLEDFEISQIIDSHLIDLS